MKKHMAQYAPEDPHYETITDERTGKTKRVKVRWTVDGARQRPGPVAKGMTDQQRGIPDGLSKRDARVLKKIRKRAHRLDEGMNLCGFRVGYTFFIGERVHLLWSPDILKSE
jgi:hypothetical protein